MNHLLSRCIVLAVILIAIIIPACSALQIDLSPARIQEGGTVTITIRGLENNSVFAINIQSDVKPESDGTFDFQTTGFVMPFSLSDGYFLVEAHNVVNKGKYPNIYAAGVEAKTQGTSGIFGNKVGENPPGVVQIYLERTIPEDTFDFIRIYGNARDVTSAVPVMLELNGKKQGPADSRIMFSIEGVSSGSADILVTVNGNIVLTRNVLIGSAPPATTATTATTIPTSVPASAGTTTTNAYVTEPSGVTVTPVVSTPPVVQLPDIISVSSMDKRFMLSTISSAISGSTPDNIRIMNVGDLPLSNGLYALSNTYLIFPETARFSPKATVIVTMDDATVQQFDQYRPFIATYTGGQWVAADSRRDGSHMLTDISSGGKFALATMSVVTPHPTTAPQTKITPGSRITSFQTTQSPAATPTEPVGMVSPTRKSGVGLAECVLIAGIAVFLARYRHKN